MPTASHPDARILIVDDEEASVRSLSRMLRAAGYLELRSTTTPADALGVVLEYDPDLVLLDLHMPEVDGIAVLEQLRAAASPQSYLPVLMLTGDQSREARHRALAAGATEFIHKPFELGEVLLRIGNLLQTRSLHLRIIAQNEVLERRVAERTVELESAQLDTLERLALAAEFRDDETGRHTERVGEIAALLGNALGLAEEDVFLLRRAAPLHDVGKIAIPDAILRKPGPLSADEWTVMKSHAMMGGRILSGGRSRVIRLAEEIASCHHEAWDGSGYPAGLSGDVIPLAARLVTVADVFDALTSERVYRSAWPVARVIEHIREFAGRRFDPTVAALFNRRSILAALVEIRRGTGLSASADDLGRARGRPLASVAMEIPASGGRAGP